MKDHQLNLSHKTIVVTGAGSGIGREAALTFAAHGACVVLVGRQVKKLEAVYDQIIANGCPKPIIHPMNLATANPDHYREFAENLEKQCDSLDGVLHNAGAFTGLTPIEHYDIENWYKVVQTNLNAPFLMTRALLPLLKKSKQASLIFTTSTVGHVAKAYWGAHAIAHAGIEAMSQVLASELENTNVRVNCIDPGAVRTQIRAKAYPAEDASTLCEPASIMSTYVSLMCNREQTHGQRICAQPA